MSEPRPERTLAMIFAPLRAKPWLGGVFFAFLAAGVGLGWFGFPGQWSAALRVGLGLLLGLCGMLSLYLPRMIAVDYD